MKKRVIWAYELEEKFGYSPKYVPNLLYRLKKAGLILALPLLFGLRVTFRWNVTSLVGWLLPNTFLLALQGDILDVDEHSFVYCIQ